VAVDGSGKRVCWAAPQEDKQCVCQDLHLSHNPQLPPPSAIAQPGVTLTLFK